MSKNTKTDAGLKKKTQKNYKFEIFYKRFKWMGKQIDLGH